MTKGKKKLNEKREPNTTDRGKDPISSLDDGKNGRNTETWRTGTTGQS